MRIARVFPQRTRLTPIDDLSYYDVPGFFDEADEIHISVLFTWDIPRAEWLAEQWKHVAPIKMGGPAYNYPSGDFIPGMYVSKGAVITSRGCPNRCWFCSVWRREPKLKELPITQGWNVLDDNLLACSEQHIRSVFTMLKNQKHPIEFTGGFESKRLLSWHVELLTWLRIKQIFFAYDISDDYEPLIIASKLLWNAGFTPQSHKIRAYVLIGYPQDTFIAAEFRLRQCLKLGITPMAMLWRNESGVFDYRWKQFQRRWARPIIIHQKNIYKKWI